MSTAKIPHVSEEEENYLRMHLLMTGISSRAVRVLFDKEFSPVCVDATIKKKTGKLIDLKNKHIINKAQWRLLFPHVGVPDSNTFDVTLMVVLLRNLTNLPPPTGGYDKLPFSSDTTPTADLARIKHYRNSLAHFENGKIKSSVFVTAWEDISGAVKRLGGLDMEEECKELRAKHLDQSTVPWNIRGNTLDKKL
ncbi:E3 ubiquitin-protein ligase DZIP3-like [Mytilus galloprovincialis]|uniref:E3 ubiquitin-protein ligase DZIP3-like n=1 Tax=Mytilus galloprovincialis TaxID=29158 RepID=UPI003F7C56F2